MFSRAHLLIQRDFERLENDKPWGISASPLSDDNLFEWVVKMNGLKETLWETGIFRLYLKFDEAYNQSPPQVCFHTIPFHPNIDMITGKPCIDFIDNKDLWQQKYTITTLLLSLQSLLSNPVLESAINMEAATMLTTSIASYKQIVLDCVTASQRVEAGMDPYIKKEKGSFVLNRKLTHGKDSMEVGIKDEQPIKKGLSKVSFEDYHNTWSGIATSKCHPSATNPLLEALKEKPSLQSTHFGLPASEIQQQIMKQMNDHTTLMYGKFQTKPSQEEIQLAKRNELNKMKKIYFQPRTPKTPSAFNTDVVDVISKSNQNNNPNHQQQQQGDAQGKEVDDLVKWTKELDAEQL